MAKYFTTEEIRSDEVLRERLKTYKGPSVRGGFCVDLVSDCKKKFFKDRDVNILDCGTASGDFVSQLALQKNIKNVYGLDVDDYIHEGNRIFFTDFKIVDLNREKIPYPDSFFDIVTAWCVIPHLENPHNFIREVRRILKSDGLFIFTLVNTDSSLSRRYYYEHGEIPGFHERNNHISLFTPAILKKTVLKYFELVKKDYFVNEGILMGVKGGMIRLTLKIASILSYSLKTKLKRRWGSKMVYILRKQS